MPRPSTLASVELDVAVQPKPAILQETPEPFRILVAGDFSGGAGKNRRTIPVDRDNFEQVLALLAPELRLELPSGELPISFITLDDFHPDNLYARLQPFQELCALRQSLEEGTAPPERTPGPPPRDLSGADVLGMMMGESPGAARARSDWDRMLSDLVKPYAVPSPDPRQAERIARVDAAIAAEMRALLHNPAFQQIEAAWRGLHFLIHRLRTGEDLKVFVVDLPQSELASGDLARALEQESWGVMAGLYYFGANDEELLARISALAQEAQAPFLAGLAPDVVGLTRVFGDLRTSLKARWLGLILPRFLLRLPYGPETVSTDAFAFEELPSPPEHEHYLWGHPALVCSCLIGQAFERDGWSLHPGSVREIDGLPAHVFRYNGESELKPCAEILLTDSAAGVLVGQGFMPLVTVKGSDRVRMPWFQSIADPPAPLAGKWSQ